VTRIDPKARMGAARSTEEPEQKEGSNRRAHHSRKRPGKSVKRKKEKTKGKPVLEARGEKGPGQKDKEKKLK